MIPLKYLFLFGENKFKVDPAPFSFHMVLVLSLLQFAPGDTICVTLWFVRSVLKILTLTKRTFTSVYHALMDTGPKRQEAQLSMTANVCTIFQTISAKNENFGDKPGVYAPVKVPSFVVCSHRSDLTCL